MDVIKGAQCDTTKMGQYVMAAYLNVLSKRVNFQTLESVRNMWTEWSTRGYYEPTAGQRWNAYQIVDYLKKTMD
ncbi:hypothetical protein SRABI118_02125 [Massilia sp. Bi118]|nr:hypothetical protein SRABI118_02125 [Massilia sp. Bi118]